MNSPDGIESSEEGAEAADETVEESGEVDGGVAVRAEMSEEEARQKMGKLLRSYVEDEEEGEGT